MGSNGNAATYEPLADRNDFLNNRLSNNSLEFQAPVCPDHVHEAGPRPCVPLMHVKTIEREMFSQRHTRAGVRLTAVACVISRIALDLPRDVGRDLALPDSYWMLELKPVAVAPRDLPVDVAPFDAVAIRHGKAPLQQCTWSQIECEAVLSRLPVRRRLRVDIAIISRAAEMISEAAAQADACLLVDEC